MKRIPHLKPSFFHDLDPWFDKNDHYFYYKVESFPNLKRFIGTIPCIHPETAVFAIMDGPVRIPPHRAESNWLLRYHLTIEAVPGECTLYTHSGAHDHLEGDSFLFDHSRYHEVSKRGPGRRVVLILDMKRF
jgi:aspartyl/asparaginyl beta-hydroxylase (cupin superfamily)